jgi:hypothetical protein
LKLTIQISSSYISIVDSLKLALRRRRTTDRAAHHIICEHPTYKERVVIMLEWDTKAGWSLFKNTSFLLISKF